MLLYYEVYLHFHIPSYQKLVNYKRKSTLWSFCMPGSVQLLYGFSVSRQVCPVVADSSWKEPKPSAQEVLMLR